MITGLSNNMYYKSEEYTNKLIKNTSDIHRKFKYDHYLNLAYDGIRLSRMISSKLLSKVKDSFEEVINNAGRGKMQIYVLDEIQIHALLLDLLDRKSVV